MGFSSVCFRSLSPAAQGSAYLLTHRSWISRIGTGFRKWSFSRPRRRVTTRPASSSCRRCFITPKRVIGKRPSSSRSVCPSARNSSSSRLRLVGSARALNTASTLRKYVTVWSHVKRGVAADGTIDELLSRLERACRHIDGDLGVGGGVGELGDRTDRGEPAGQRVLGAGQDVVDLQGARVG